MNIPEVGGNESAVAGFVKRPLMDTWWMSLLLIIPISAPLFYMKMVGIRVLMVSLASFVHSALSLILYSERTQRSDECRKISTVKRQRCMKWKGRMWKLLSVSHIEVT